MVELTQYKYMVYTDDNKKILTMKGFRPVEKINDSTIRLFTAPSNVKDFMENHILYHKIEYDIVRVLVNYVEQEKVERKKYDEEK